MTSTGSRMRRRYNKGKSIRGRNINNGILGRWRKTQVEKRLSREKYITELQTGEVE